MTHFSVLDVSMKFINLPKLQKCSLRECEKKWWRRGRSAMRSLLFCSESRSFGGWHRDLQMRTPFSAEVKRGSSRNWTMKVASASDTTDGQSLQQAKLKIFPNFAPSSERDFAFRPSGFFIERLRLWETIWPSSERWSIRSSTKALWNVRPKIYAFWEDGVLQPTLLFPILEINFIVLRFIKFRY